jgi:DNA-binding NarL/FixJ family response regulator
MANRSGLLEKESTAFAEEKPPVRTNYSSFSQVSAANVKLPVMDNLLEDTLVSIKPAEPLTKRESEILKLIIAGKTNKKIAQKIYRTERTVEYHRHRLMRKLGAHNAADLVKRAIAMGIV